ncbi:MAG TPA: type II toxin-antitoxin system PemK/MazF family toxin [Caulobacteraceae bacterium]
MRRGDLVTVVSSGDYGKPRPALIVQADLYTEHPSVTVLPLTSDLRDAPALRVTVEAGVATGLRRPSQVMVDKATTPSPAARLAIRSGGWTRRRWRALARLWPRS